MNTQSPSISNFALTALAQAWDFFMSISFSLNLNRRNQHDQRFSNYTTDTRANQYWQGCGKEW